MRKDKNIRNGIYISIIGFAITAMGFFVSAEYIIGGIMASLGCGGLYFVLNEYTRIFD